MFYLLLIVVVTIIYLMLLYKPQSIKHTKTRYANRDDLYWDENMLISGQKDDYGNYLVFGKIEEKEGLFFIYFRNNVNSDLENQGKIKDLKKAKQVIEKNCSVAYDETITTFYDRT